jgi:hypothetical protein
MPTLREMKVVLRPLLDKRPDLALHRQFLFYAPFAHVFRGVWFQQSRWGGHFTVEPIATLLCDRLEVQSHPFLEGARLFKMLPDEPWDEKASQELRDFVENCALPKVQPIDNLRKLRRKWMTPLGTAAIACLRGDYDRAYKLTEDSVSFATNDVAEMFSNGSVMGFRHDDYTWRSMYLHHLIKTDRSKIPEQLLEWERQAVIDTKLTKYWKPTPFDEA